MSARSVSLPPAPVGECAPGHQERVAQYLAKRVHFNQHLVKLKSFRNPNLYSLLVEMCNLDEYGSNLPKERYDPAALREEVNYEALSTHSVPFLLLFLMAQTDRLQQETDDRREKERAQARASATNPTIAFVSKGAPQPSGRPESQSPGRDAARKSRWDVDRQ